jgi:hypothetical protein
MLGTLKWDFESDFENLGVVLYSTEMFSEMGFVQLEMEWRRSCWWFHKKALVFLCSSSEQLTRETTLPWYGTGLSS